MQVRSAFYTIFGDYIYKDDSMITMSELTKLLKSLEFTDEAIKAAIYRMRHQKIVVSLKKNGKTYYTLTQEGFNKMTEGMRRTFTEFEESKWDKKWRVLIYSIPEKERQVRDQFRKEITWMGFGQVTPGTWITPHNLFDPILRLIKQYTIENYVQMFEAEHVGLANTAHLVSQAWDLVSTNNKFKDFITEFKPRLQTFKEEGDRWKAEIIFAERVILVHEYRKFLHIDPQLPLELFPNGWLGEEARQLFNQYYKSLSPVAIQFYNSIRGKLIENTNVR